MLADVIVSAARSSTRFWMSARASQTLFWAFSSSDSPHATGTTASTPARNPIIHLRIEWLESTNQAHTRDWP